MRNGGLTPLVDAGRVLVALRRACLGPGESVSLTLERAWPWRRHGFCALYAERRAGRRRSWAVLRPAAGELPRRLGCAARAGDLRRLSGLDAWGMAMERDPEIGAAAVLGGARLENSLRRWLPGRKPLRGLRVRPLSYKPLRRLTVELRLPDGRCLYGKALRPQDRSRLEGLWRALASSPAAARLALPCGVLEDPGLVLFERCAGTALDRLVPGPAAARGVELAGEALAELHRGATALAPRHRPGCEMETLDRWLGATARAFPEMAARLGAARCALGLAASEPGEATTVPGHRDYHPGQLLVSPDAVTILDLDTAAMVEPELDAGNFLAHLDLLRFDRRPAPPASALARGFRAAYERRAGRRLCPQRLIWYRAAALLRLACVYRFRPRGADLGNQLLQRSRELLVSGATSTEVI